MKKDERLIKRGKLNFQIILGLRGLHKFDIPKI